MVALLLLWAAPAHAFSKQTGTRTMADGTSIAYDHYEPDGTPHAGGWPGVVVLHVLGFAKSVDARSPLIASMENDAVHSTNLAKIKALAAARSPYATLPRIKTPVYMFQGRVDYAFDVTQAENGFSRISGPKHLYIG